MEEGSRQLKNIKFFGGIGSILYLLFVIPNIGWILWVAGIILLFIAIKKLADVSEKKEIFKNFLAAFILETIALVILIGGYIAVILEAGGIPKGEAEVRRMVENLGQILGQIAIVIFISWVLTIISGYFFKKSFKGIAEVSRIGLFRITGNVVFVGSILSIILIGLFLIYPVGAILMAVSFFSLPDSFPTKVLKTKD